jgi:nucleoside-diphosphate-sugar epimerase
MRVVVLGGTRFIGRAISEELAAAGHELLIVHRGRSEPDGLPEAAHLHVDRSELDSARERLSEFHPDAAVDTYALTRANAEAALGALPAGLATVVLSSIDVYQAFAAIHDGVQSEAVPLDEESLLRGERYPLRGQDVALPDDADGHDYEKLDVEDAYLASGAVVLRLPFVYGEHDHRRREEFILRRVRAGRERIPIGPGNWLGSRAYVREVARAVRLAMQSGLRGEVFNVCERRTWPLRVWAERILEAAGSRAELVEVPDALLPGDMDEKGSRQHLLVSAEKARHVLGFEHGDPGEGVRRSVTWHLENPPASSSEDFSEDDRALAAAPVT